MGKLANKEFPKVITKKGWPWDNEVDERLYSGIKDWPKITIITPSYNQKSFLEETIRSIVLQNYPNLEYIIIDGGSTDNSIEIIKKYKDYLSHWVSEKDFGQSHAINKGIYYSTGELINWINSDDILLPNSLFNLATKYIESSYDRIILIGYGYEIDENSKIIRERKVENDEMSESNLYFKIKGTLIQQSIFFSRRILTEAGGINPLIKYPMDVDLYNKMGFLKPKVEILGHFIGGFRKHIDSKTVSQNFLMLEEKLTLLQFLSFYDSNKEYYKSQTVAYILGTSFHGIILRKKIHFIILAIRNINLSRKNLYKYMILLKKIVA